MSMWWCFERSSMECYYLHLSSLYTLKCEDFNSAPLCKHESRSCVSILVKIKVGLYNLINAGPEKMVVISVCLPAKNPGLYSNFRSHILGKISLLRAWLLAVSQRRRLTTLDSHGTFVGRTPATYKEEQWPVNVVCSFFIPCSPSFLTINWVYWLYGTCFCATNRMVMEFPLPPC